MPEKPIETILNDIEAINRLILDITKSIHELEKANIEMLVYIRRREAEYKNSWF